MIRGNYIIQQKNKKAGIACKVKEKGTDLNVCPLREIT